jgi:hypothetical protein
VSDKHVRALRETSRRTRGRLAGYAPRGGEGQRTAAHRRDDLARTARRAAARLAAAEARLRRAREKTL